LFSLPGTNGKILVYGHSSSYAWDKSNFTKIFRTVNQLKAGDKVYITYSGKQYTYEVTFQEQVNPADTSRYSGAGEELLLYTCWPPDSIKTRLLVHAKPVGTVAQK
jgi:sortase A